MLISSCAAKKEINPLSETFWNDNLDLPELNFNEIISFIEQTNSEPPRCLSDCNGINEVDPLNGNSFCPWMMDLQDKDCLTDCTKNEKVMFSYFAFICEESMDKNEEYQSLNNISSNLMHSIFLNDEILNSIPNDPSFSLMLVDLLPPQDKVVSFEYNSFSHAQENISSFIIVNKSGETLSLDWVKPNGELESKGSIEIESIYTHGSYQKHAFKISNTKNNNTLNYFIVPKGFGLVIIR